MVNLKLKNPRQAGEECWGTDEDIFVDIFSKHGFQMLQAVFDDYAKLCDFDIEKSIKREMSMNLKKALTAIGKKKKAKGCFKVLIQLLTFF